MADDLKAFQFTFSPESLEKIDSIFVQGAQNTLRQINDAINLGAGGLNGDPSQANIRLQPIIATLKRHGLTNEVTRLEIAKTIFDVHTEALKHIESGKTAELNALVEKTLTPSTFDLLARTPEEHKNLSSAQQEEAFLQEQLYNTLKGYEALSTVMSKPSIAFQTPGTNQHWDAVFNAARDGINSNLLSVLSDDFDHKLSTQKMIEGNNTAALDLYIKGQEESIDLSTLPTTTEEFKALPPMDRQNALITLEANASLMVYKALVPILKDPDVVAAHGESVTQYWKTIENKISEIEEPAAKNALQIAMLAIRPIEATAEKFDYTEHGYATATPDAKLDTQFEAQNDPDWLQAIAHLYAEKSAFASEDFDLTRYLSDVNSIEYFENHPEAIDQLKAGKVPSDLPQEHIAALSNWGARTARYFDGNTAAALDVSRIITRTGDDSLSKGAIIGFQRIMDTYHNFSIKKGLQSSHAFFEAAGAMASDPINLAFGAAILMKAVGRGGAQILKGSFIDGLALRAGLLSDTKIIHTALKYGVPSGVTSGVSIEYGRQTLEIEAGKSEGYDKTRIVASGVIAAAATVALGAGLGKLGNLAGRGYNKLRGTGKMPEADVTVSVEAPTKAVDNNADVTKSTITPIQETGDVINLTEMRAARASESNPNQIIANNDEVGAAKAMEVVNGSPVDSAPSTIPHNLSDRHNMSGTEINHTVSSAGNNNGNGGGGNMPFVSGGLHDKFSKVPHSRFNEGEGSGGIPGSGSGGSKGGNSTQAGKAAPKAAAGVIYPKMPAELVAMYDGTRPLKGGLDDIATLQGVIEDVVPAGTHWTEHKYVLTLRTLLRTNRDNIENSDTLLAQLTRTTNDHVTDAENAAKIAMARAEVTKAQRIIDGEDGTTPGRQESSQPVHDGDGTQHPNGTEEPNMNNAERNAGDTTDDATPATEHRADLSIAELTDRPEPSILRIEKRIGFFPEKQARQAVKQAVKDRRKEFSKLTTNAEKSAYLLKLIDDTVNSVSPEKREDFLGELLSYEHNILDVVHGLAHGTMDKKNAVNIIKDAYSAYFPAARNNEGIILFDLDHFKKVNPPVNEEGAVGTLSIPQLLTMAKRYDDVAGRRDFGTAEAGTSRTWFENLLTLPKRLKENEEEAARDLVSDFSYAVRTGTSVQHMMFMVLDARIRSGARKIMSSTQISTSPHINNLFTLDPQFKEVYRLFIDAGFKARGLDGWDARVDAPFLNDKINAEWKEQAAHFIKNLPYNPITAFHYVIAGSGNSPKFDISLRKNFKLKNGLGLKSLYNVMSRNANRKASFLDKEIPLYATVHRYVYGPLTAASSLVGGGTLLRSSPFLLKNTAMLGLRLAPLALATGLSVTTAGVTLSGIQEGLEYGVYNHYDLDTNGMSAKFNAGNWIVQGMSKAADSTAGEAVRYIGWKTGQESWMTGVGAQTLADFSWKFADDVSAEDSAKVVTDTSFAKTIDSAGIGRVGSLSELFDKLKESGKMSALEEDWFETNEEYLKISIKLSHESIVTFGNKNEIAISSHIER